MVVCTPPTWVPFTWMVNWAPAGSARSDRNSAMVSGPTPSRAVVGFTGPSKAKLSVPSLLSTRLPDTTAAPSMVALSMNSRLLEAFR